MGNTCECISRQTDDAEDALLSPEFDGGQPRGPPPPYQPRAPLYAYAQMTEEQRIQLVQRLTLIQCLPCGRYADSGKDEKKSLEVDLEESTTTGSGDHGEKKGGDKGDKDRECPICMLDFVVGQPIRLLPCMHYYHMRCIDDWLMRSLTCPTCMERVDVGVRNTVISSSQSSLRRRRVGSSSSTTSTISTASTSSSVDQLLTSGGSGSGGGSRGGHRQGPQLQLRTTTPTGGSRGHRTRPQRNCNEIQQQGLPQSAPTVYTYRVNPVTMNLEPITTTNTNVEVRPSSSSSSRGGALRYGGGVSPPGSPLARGRGGSPPSSPPLIEYHYEYLMPNTPSNSAH